MASTDIAACRSYNVNRAPGKRIVQSCADANTAVSQGGLEAAPLCRSEYMPARCVAADTVLTLQRRNTCRCIHSTCHDQCFPVHRSRVAERVLCECLALGVACVCQARAVLDQISQRHMCLLTLTFGSPSAAQAQRCSASDHHERVDVPRASRTGGGRCPDEDKSAAMRNLRFRHLQ